jgi:Na+-transporting methylmalonyl-CoA/oxaloacetate decarboxylase gamma subunit
MPDDPKDDPLPADDIRRGWTTERFLLIITAIFAGLGTLQSKCNNVDSKAAHEETVQKVDATDAKVDKAAVVAVEVEKKLTAQNAAVARTAEKVEEVHNAVRKMDK